MDSGDKYETIKFYVDLWIPLQVTKQIKYENHLNKGKNISFCFCQTWLNNFS